MTRLASLWKLLTLNPDYLIDRRLSSLSSEDQQVIHRVLGSMVPPSYMTNNPFLRLQLHAITMIQVLWYSDVMVALMPTYEQLKPYEKIPGKLFARAIGWDSMDNVLSHQLKCVVTGSYSGLEHRFDAMHGIMIQKALSVSNIGVDVLWYGRNRERILAALPLIVKEDEVTKERIEVLLESLEDEGSSSLASGML